MAQVDYFLKLDGIDGESQDAKHKGEIDVLGYSFGATNSGSGSFAGGSGAGKVQMQDFSFTMKTNKASPKLFLACSSGEHIKSAILTVRKAGKDQQEFLKITMSEVLVSSFQHQGGDPMPNDQITLNFAKIEKEYKEQKPDGTLGGSVKTGWDLKQNKKV